jgi:hypothetical protein
MTPLRIFWTGLGSVAVVAVIIGALTASSGFVYRHWQDPDRPMEFDGDRVVAGDNEQVDEEKPTPTTSGLRPKVVVEDATYNFGRLDPLTMASHTFCIRNEGEGPLQLRKGPTTCQCTISDVAQKELPPGKAGYIRLEWNSGRDPVFAHSATIFTNDPSRPRVYLQIEGQVRQLLGVVPNALNLDAIATDEPTEQSVVFFSQVWDDFRLSTAKTSLAGLDWKVRPLDDEARKVHGAKCGWRVKVILPAGMPRGRFHEWLQLRVEPQGTAENETQYYNLAIDGRVPGRLSVFGKGVDQHGAIRFGVLTSNKEMKKTLLLKVRDPQRKLKISRLTVQPSFLDVSLEPRAASQDKGLYALTIKVPKNAPRCSYMPPRPGKVFIEFDHPRIKDLQMHVELAVVKDKL